MFHSQYHLVTTANHIQSLRSQICVYVHTHFTIYRGWTGQKIKILDSIEGRMPRKSSARYFGHTCHRFVRFTLGCQFDRDLGRVQSHQHAVERKKVSLRYRQSNPHSSTIQVVLHAECRPRIPTQDNTKEFVFEKMPPCPFSHSTGWGKWNFCYQ